MVNLLNKCYFCSGTDVSKLSTRLLGGRWTFLFVYLCFDHNPYRITPEKESGIFYLKKRYYDKRTGIYYDKRRTGRKAAEEAQQTNESSPTAEN